MALVGIEKLYYAILKTDSSTTATFDPPVYLEGVQEIQIKPKQNTTKAYAENKLWAQLTSLEDIEVTINLFDISKDNQVKLLGYTAATEGGVYASSTDSAPYIALLYKANTSREGVSRYGVIYKGKFQLPENSVKGQEDKTEYQTPQMNATFQPLIKSGMWQYFVDTDDADCPENIDTTWFASVILPTKKTVA